MSRVSYVPSGAKIKVVGLGGGGCNAITRMVREGIRGVEFIAMNTDAQHLAVTEAPVRLQLGERCTRCLGAGGDHNVGQQAAEEALEQIKQTVAGADMTFITAGMGGGTGTGSIPVVAEVAKKSGSLTIGVVTKPFDFEGAHRSKVAESGLANLIDKVDTLIIVPNDRLLDLCDRTASVSEAFRKADEVLHQGVQAIAEVVTVPGLINLDFADIKTILKDAGPAWMSIGYGSKQNRARDAALQALNSPLLDVSMEGAKGVLFNIVGNDLSLFEVNEAADVIKGAIDPSANVIFGVVLDPSMGDNVRLTLVATGFAAQCGQTDGAWDREITSLLKGIKTEQELEVPAFMRRQHAMSGRRPQPARRL